MNLKSVLYMLVLWSSSLFSQENVEVLSILPSEVSETSGLIFHNGSLITHNDSGNSPQLFEIDTTSYQITRTVTISNVENIDWEDLAQDENYIYIGDFGNNSGDRQDLNILKILKSDYDNSDSVTAEIINFLYEDQTDFTSSEDSDFDAEGFFSLGDNLIILTKQWQQNGTVAYKVPKLSGAFLAERLDSYQVNGLVTGATYNQNTNQLSIVGYSQFLFPFYVLVDDVQENAIFEGEKTKTNLNIGQAQVEAITLVGAEQFYISSEDFSNPPLVNSPSRLFTFSLDSEEEENPPGEENPEGENTPDEELVVYKTFGSQSLNYSLITNRAVTGMGVFDVTGRMVTYIPLERISTDPIDISSFNQSLYYLTFFLIDDAISVPFFRD